MRLRACCAPMRGGLWWMIGCCWTPTPSATFAPHRRRIGYIFQEGRLFPHLNVRQNLLYGRWFAPRDARRENLSRVVEMLGIGPLLERRPGALSGGEKARLP